MHPGHEQGRTTRRLIRLAGLLLLFIAGAAQAEAPELEIEITGLEGELLQAARDNLSLWGQRDEPLLNAVLIKGLHRKADNEIRQALRPFGYYRATVQSDLQRTDEGWRARYSVDAGEPIRLDEVKISIEGAGADDSALRHWREAFPLQTGDVLRHQSYEAAKKDLRQTARERGYIEGRLSEHRIRVNLDTYSATITLRLHTGPRYRFGPVHFEQDTFAEEFLRRYLPFQPGEPYEAGKLLNLHRRLVDSDYFRRVEVSPMLDEARAERIPVRIELVARNRKRYTAGIGYATDTGARGSLGFENRRANRWGHRYGATLKQSEISASLTARYRVPMRRPATDYLTYTASWIDEETDTVERTTTTFGLELTQQAGAWQRDIGVNYETERYRLDTEGDSALLIPHVRWLRISAERRIHIRRGWMLSLGLRGAHDEVLSDTSFLQTRNSAKFIRGVTRGSRILLRATLGASWTGEFVELPASQRFYAGGDQSVRGYAFESLGPQDATGTLIGGKHLAVGSVEYELDTGENTAAAVFYDAGNAFNSEDFDAKRGAGLGFRWWTPIGAIRVDLARALDKPSEPWRLHLTLGPDL